MPCSVLFMFLNGIEVACHSDLFNDLEAIFLVETVEWLGSLMSDI